MRQLYFSFAIFSYLVALASQVWFILYLTNLNFLNNIYAPQTTSTLLALIVDFTLLSIFALQHSIMARESFKKALIKLIPAPIERAFYTLLSGVSFILICYFYQPIDGLIWDIEDSFWSSFLWVGFIFGWGLSLYATFIIDHFELFGLKQPYYYLKEKRLPQIEFKEKSLYRFVRHPIQVGVLIGLWITPKMSFGHLFLSTLLTIYIFIGLYFEEKALVKEFGNVYKDYKKRVGMLFPKIKVGYETK